MACSAPASICRTSCWSPAAERVRRPRGRVAEHGARDRGSAGGAGEVRAVPEARRAGGRRPADDVWDIGLIGAEPARAEKIAFTAAYAEIEATYLVPPGSPMKTIADVDKPGVRIAVTARSAYGLWLERNIAHATLVRSDSLDAAWSSSRREKLDALAGLRPRLLSRCGEDAGRGDPDGQFTAVQQAVGTAKANVAAAAWLRAFVEEAKASGLVARLIEQLKVQGLSVAPPG